MIKVLFFGPVAERIGTREMQCAYAPGLTLHRVMQQIAMQHSEALPFISFIAVNQQQVRDQQTVLCDGDEVALMAKFSGG